VVISDSVDVIEDQRHPPTPPHLALSTHLAYARLDAIFEQSRL
jgi:hypothetical protein